jgi:hypothetical protein
MYIYIYIYICIYIHIHEYMYIYIYEYLGECFQRCITQDFETLDNDGSINADNRNYNHENKNSKKKFEIKNNEIFLTELLYYVKSVLENSMTIINTNNELFERCEILGCYSLYILYTFLKPENKKMDKKLFRYIWNTQKDIPYIVLYNNVILYIGKFLELYIPTITKLEPADRTICLNLYVQECDESFRYYIYI